jgi:heme exporter protein D
MDLGPHAAFVVASYAVTAGALILLAAWLVYDGRRQQRAIAELEARGVRRGGAARPPSRPGADA